MHTNFKSKDDTSSGSNVALSRTEGVTADQHCLKESLALINFLRFNFNWESNKYKYQLT